MKSRVTRSMRGGLLSDCLKFSEDDILQRLHKRYAFVSMNARRFVVADHVPSGMNYAPCIADFVAFDVWNSKLLFHGHEVKCSRADWLAELRQHPWKSEPIKKYMDFWWLVTADKSIVKASELPEDWGLLVVAGSGLRSVVPAPKLSPEPMEIPMMAAFSRAVQRTATRRSDG